MNEINKRAKLILYSEQSKRVSLTITSSVPSKQKKSVTEDLKVEVTFSKSADYTENQPSKSTDVPGKTKQQSLLSKIHSEEKSKSAEKEELTWSLMGGKSGKNSRTGNLWRQSTVLLIPCSYNQRRNSKCMNYSVLV